MTVSTLLPSLADCNSSDQLLDAVKARLTPHDSNHGQVRYASAHGQVRSDFTVEDVTLILTSPHLTRGIAGYVIGLDRHPIDRHPFVEAVRKAANVKGCPQFQRAFYEEVLEVAGWSNLSLLSELPNVPDDITLKVVKVGDSHIRGNVARRTKNEEVLARLAKDKSSSVCIAVLHNEYSDKALEAKYARSRDVDIRMDVAATTRDEEIMELLSDDRDQSVLCSLAENPLLPVRLQMKIAAYDHMYISMSLLRSTGLTPEAVAIIVEDVRPDDYPLQELLMKSHVVPVGDKARIAAGSRSVRVRREFFESLTLDEKAELAGSDNPKVREIVSKYLVKVTLF